MYFFFKEITIHSLSSLIIMSYSYALYTLKIILMDAPLNNSLEYCSQLWATDPKKLLIRPLVNALFCGYLMSQLT